MGAVTEATTTLGDVLRRTDERLRAGESAAPPPWPTGFPVLDSFLGGGLRPGELALLGGPQGLGKTTFALQVGAAAAHAGHPVLFVSFEHDPHALLERLLAMEAGENAGLEAPDARAVREVLEVSGADRASLLERMARRPGGAEAVTVLRDMADRFVILRGGPLTDVAAISATVQDLAARISAPPLVVVDYVQKVAGSEGPESERMVDVVGGLKDLALGLAVPVFGIAAADRDGIKVGRRLRVHHLRGAAALAYEADVVLLLNEKYDVVARHHLVYAATNADRFKAYAVLSIEKNRGGLDKVDLEFRKRFEQSRFDRQGAVVAEQLVDERLFVE